MSKALAKKPTPTAVTRYRENALQGILAQIAEDDATIAHSMDLAPAMKIAIRRATIAGVDLLGMNDEELAVCLAEYGLPGASRIQLQVALDACLGSKEAPVYLKYANDRHLLRHRGQDEDGAGKGAKVTIVLPGARVPAEAARRNAKTIDLDNLGDEDDDK